MKIKIINSIIITNKINNLIMRIKKTNINLSKLNKMNMMYKLHQMVNF